MINVLIVDDHQLVRTGVARMLSDVQGIRVVDQADSGESALEKIRALKPHVVLMDVRLQGMGGMEAARRALRIDPDLKIVGLSDCEDEPIPSQMLRAGAVGYLSKGCAAHELVSAIRRVHVGQRYISAEVARQMALKNYAGSKSNPFETLSGRELQIMLMVVHCHKVANISEHLRLSPKTVNSYRYRIFDKLNVSSDVELTLMAMRYGMIDPRHSAIVGSVDHISQAEPPA